MNVPASLVHYSKCAYLMLQFRATPVNVLKDLQGQHVTLTFLNAMMSHAIYLATQCLSLARVMLSIVLTSLL